MIETQNPIDLEGTLELPEAQVECFAIKVTMGYPDLDGEVKASVRLSR